MNRIENVWYACYGSNLSEERFGYYIIGGKPQGAKKNYAGCKDKTLPKENEEIIINAELYFAQRSRNWSNGGVAFLENDFKSKFQTLGRIYFITTEQFVEVIKQENDFYGEVHVDFQEAVIKGEHLFTEWKWYNKMVLLGQKNQCPIFTFTHSATFLPYSKPSLQYLNFIAKGIKEVFELSEQEIINYLFSKKGVLEYYTKEELGALL